MNMEKTIFWSVVLPVSISIFLIIGSYGVLEYFDDSRRDRITASFSGVGEVLVVNDIAQISFTFSQLDHDLEEARGEVNEDATGVYAELEDLGVEEKDIKTTNYSINPKYEFEDQSYHAGGIQRNRRVKIFKGYEVSHSSSIKIRDLDKASEIIGKITEAKPENVSNLRFTMEDKKRRELEDAALAMAYKDAKLRAKSVSKESGVRLKKIISIQIGNRAPRHPSGFYAPQQESSFGLDSISFKSSAPPIRVGENKIVRTSTITYEIYDR